MEYDILDLIENVRQELPQEVYDKLPVIIDQFQINTALRLCHFLSQCAHQSNNFTIRTESMRYKSADRILSVFSKYFESREEAEEYVNDPQKLANRVYANRMGNEDEQSGDGFRFIGRGFIQLTGRTNYTKFAQFMGDQNILDEPELVAEEYALESAGFYWRYIGDCNRKADLGFDVQVVKKVTRAVNGGLNGFADRLELFGKFSDLLMIQSEEGEE